MAGAAAGTDTTAAVGMLADATVAAGTPMPAVIAADAMAAGIAEAIMAAGTTVVDIAADCLKSLQKIGLEG